MTSNGDQWRPTARRPATKLDRFLAAEALGGAQGEVWYAPTAVGGSTFGVLFVAYLSRDTQVGPAELGFPSGTSLVAVEVRDPTMRVPSFLPSSSLYAPLRPTTQACLPGSDPLWYGGPALAPGRGELAHVWMSLLVVLPLGARRATRTR